MSRLAKLFVAFAAFSLAASGCGRSRPLEDTDVISIRLHPDDPKLYIGQEIQLQVEARFADGSLRDVTDEPDLRFRVTQSGVVTLLDDGRLRSLTAGRVRLLALWNGKQDRSDITVLNAGLQSIRVEPAENDVQTGQSVQLEVTGVLTDESQVDLTAGALGTGYESDHPAVCTVTADGLVFAMYQGTATVEVTHGELGAQSVFRVDGPTPPIERLDLLPAQADLPAGQVLDLELIATYQDSSTANLTDDPEVVYSSSDTQIATVSQEARVRGLAAGDVEITAVYRSHSATSDIRVTGPVELVGVEVLPRRAQLSPGDQLQLAAWAVYSDSSRVEVTAYALYNSNNSSVASVSADGLIQAAGPGTALVTAAYEGFVDGCQVDVLAAQLERIEVIPDSAQLERGQELQLQVLAHYADGSSLDVTSQAGFVSDDPGVASVSADGLVRAQSPGSTSVSASFGGLDDRCQVTVATPTLEWIELLPESAVLGLGDTLQLTVIGHFSDGGQQDMTAAAFGTTYESSDPLAVSVDPDGLARALDAGVVTVTARNAEHADTARVEVRDNPTPSLSSIDPDQLVRGSSGVTLSAHGSDFVADSVVRVESVDLATTFVDAGLLRAVLPDWVSADEGIRQVVVYNPPPGGGTSNSLPLLVVSAPTVTTVSPDRGLQGRAVRVAFYGSGLLGCAVVTDNPGIAVSDVAYTGDGLHLFATFTVDPSAPTGPSVVTLSNLAGDATTRFVVLEDSGFADCLVPASQVVYLSGVQTCDDVIIDTGAVVYGTGDEPLQLLATGVVEIRGEIRVSGFAGADGYYNPADGGAGGPGGGGGGGGGDGSLDGEPPSAGGPGSPPGQGGGLDVGPGSASGDGGGTGAGSGISSGCGQAGGGGAFGGDGGDGGGDAGVGSGGPGGLANTQGSDYNGGTGGGGGSTCGSNCGGGGGGGGGVLVIATTGGDITIEGALFADGGDGGDGYSGTGSAGGGSGGRITLTAAGGHIRIEDTISARGGDGGRADAGDGGGGGGGGRIIIDAGGGGVDDTLGYYDVAGGQRGQSRDNGFDGEPGQVGVVDVQN